MLIFLNYHKFIYLYFLLYLINKKINLNLIVKLIIINDYQYFYFY